MLLYYKNICSTDADKTEKLFLSESFIFHLIAGSGKDGVMSFDKFPLQLENLLKVTNGINFFQATFLCFTKCVIQYEHCTLHS